MTANEVRLDSAVLHKCEHSEKIGIKAIWLSLRLSTVKVLHLIEPQTIIFASSSLRQQWFNPRCDRQAKSEKHALIRDAAFDVIRAEERSRYSRRGNECKDEWWRQWAHLFSRHHYSSIERYSSAQSFYSRFERTATCLWLRVRTVIIFHVFYVRPFT